MFLKSKECAAVFVYAACALCRPYLFGGQIGRFGIRTQDGTHTKIV
jgi:hypothetical protein